MRLSEERKAELWEYTERIDGYELRSLLEELREKGEENIRLVNEGNLRASAVADAANEIIVRLEQENTQLRRELEELKAKVAGLRKRLLEEGILF